MASISANNDNDIVANNNNDNVANSNDDIIANNDIVVNSNYDNDVIENNNTSADNAIMANNDNDIAVENNDILVSNDVIENNNNHEADEQIEGFQDETTQNVPNHDVASSTIVNSDTSDNNIDRKLFVGGLNMEITESEIRNYFSVYGNIESISLIPCRNAAKKNGFAFIVFETVEAVNITKAVSNHSINGKPVYVQTAKLRHSKIFINLSNELQEEDVKAYFSEFGNIIAIDLPCNNETNERKGFCIITYDSAEVVDQIVRTPIHTIKGIEVSIQKSPFGNLTVKNQPNSNRRKKSNKKQKFDGFNKSAGVQSGGKRKAKQDKRFRNRNNFNRNPHPNGERSNFVEPTFGDQPNLANTQNFYGRRNFHGRHNFGGRQGFEGRPNVDGGYNFNRRQNVCTEPTFNNQQNLDRSQQFYGNRHNFGTEQISGNRQHSMVRPPNIRTEQAFSPFLQTNSNSNANKINVWSSDVPNLASQSTNSSGYGNNQVDNGIINYQQGYWSKSAATNGGNAGNTFSATNNNFGQRQSLENQNNANNPDVFRNMANTNSVNNQGYNNNYRGMKFVHNSAYANNNNRNNKRFVFAPDREGIHGNTRSMNENAKGSSWVGFNANINPNDNRRYQPY